MTALYPITLSAIRAARPCDDGWTKLLKYLGSPPKSEWESIRVTLGDIAESNGSADAWWCAQCLPNEARRDVIRALLPCVKRAAEHTTDNRVHGCIAVIERWVDGLATEDDLRAAAEAATPRAATATAAAATAWAATATAWAAAAWAATATAWAAAAAEAATERKQQAADIITVFGRLN